MSVWFFESLLVEKNLSEELIVCLNLLFVSSACFPVAIAEGLGQPDVAIFCEIQSMLFTMLLEVSSVTSRIPDACLFSNSGVQVIHP